MTKLRGKCLEEIVKSLLGRTEPLKLDDVIGSEMEWAAVCIEDYKILLQAMYRARRKLAVYKGNSCISENDINSYLR